VPGGVFPLYHVLADIGEFAGGQVFPAGSSAPAKVIAMAIGKGEQRRVLVGNLTAEKLPVTLRDLHYGARVTILDESSVRNAMTDPQAFRRHDPAKYPRSGDGLSIELRPYSTIRIDTAT